jgi:hypothetical protein
VVISALFALAPSNRAEVQLPRVTVPGERELKLDGPGRYTVYYEAEGATDQTVALPPVTVSVLPRGGGADVAVHPYDHFSASSIGDYSGRAIATVQIATPGRYQVRTTGRPASSGADVFLQEVPETNGLTWLYAAALVTGPVGFFGGVALFIVALMIRLKAQEMRPSANRALAAWTRGAVPGWYTDPEMRHELRYWDGQTWTVHVFHHGVQALDLPPPGPASIPSGEEDRQG